MSQFPRGVVSCGTALAACVALLCGGCLYHRNPAGVDDGPSGDRGLQAKVDSLAAMVADARGLTFKRAVVGTAVTSQEYAQRWGSDGPAGDTSGLGEYRSRFNKELFQLGFSSDPSYDFQSDYQGAMTEAVAGFYVPGTDSLFIVNYSADAMADPVERRWFEYIIAHELTHALQDQWFHAFARDITSSIHLSANETDFLLSWQDLTEGDADFAAEIFDQRYWAGSADPEADAVADLSQRAGSFLNVERLFAAGTLGNPFFLGYLMYSPYVLGGGYAASRYAAAGDWSRINDRYSSYTTTCAEIVTGAYTGIRTFPNLLMHQAIGTDTTGLDYVDDDNLGVVMLLGLLPSLVDSAHAADALGWRGDHLVYANRSSSGYGRMLWAFALDDSTTASWFLDVLTSHARSRPGEIGTSYTDSTRGWAADTTYRVRLTGSLFTTVLVRYQNEVYWLENLLPGQEAEAVSSLKSWYNSPSLAKRAVVSMPRHRKVPRGLPRSGVVGMDGSLRGEYGLR